MKLIFIVSAIVALLNTEIKNTGSSNIASAIVDGVIYRAILYGDQSISIKTGNKTVLHIKRADLYLTFEPFSKFEFRDFNGDGYPDLLIEYKSNIPGKCDLALYNKASKKFVPVSGFPDYPFSTRIANTLFFYSYQNSGCANQDWNSDLYQIINYKIVPAGNMVGRGCDNSGEALGIFVYKNPGKNQHLINKFTINELSKYRGNKLRLIDNYWQHNYSRF